MDEDTTRVNHVLFKIDGDVMKQHFVSFSFLGSKSLEPKSGPPENCFYPSRKLLRNPYSQKLLRETSHAKPQFGGHGRPHASK